MTSRGPATPPLFPNGPPLLDLGSVTTFQTRLSGEIILFSGTSTGVPLEGLQISGATLLHYSDVAQPTDLVRPVGATDTRIYPRSVVGYPDAPFLICVDRNDLSDGLSSQEVMLVTDVGANYFDVTRNFDGEGIYTHKAGATVVHTTTAFDYEVINHHITDNSNDWHPQYLDTYRHYSPELHTIQQTIDGVTTGSLKAGPPSPSLPGDHTQEGYSFYVSPADHIHPRESLVDIMTNAVPKGVVCLVPQQKKTSFYWLPDVTAPTPVTYSAPFTTSPLQIPLNDLEPPSEGTLTFGGQVGALAPSVDPQIKGMVKTQ